MSNKDAKELTTADREILFELVEDKLYETPPSEFKMTEMDDLLLLRNKLAYQLGESEIGLHDVLGGDPSHEWLVERGFLEELE